MWDAQSAQMQTGQREKREGRGQGEDVMGVMERIVLGSETGQARWWGWDRLRLTAQH